ncbi:MAG: tetratricopeptide repeat protein [Chloroflexota bacterium]|nr:tetratricopeptide repeat protein [Chloroflexota bacterium]
MATLPSGLVTFLFTDIEGSTASVHELGTDRWESVLEIHSRIIRDALATNGGVEVRTEGDAFFAVFTSPSAAVAAAAAAQRGLATATWPEGAPVRVRMGLHTGEARPASGAAAVDYVGFEIHRAARIAAAGHGGQVLVSETTESLVRDGLANGLAFRDLGEHRFKDLARSQRVYQLLIDGLRDDYPPLRSLDSIPNNLPSQVTSFVGRKRELAAALALVFTTRLLTLTGPGGSGKTRLALHLAADVLDRFPDGAWLVELASVTDPTAVGPTVASALHITERSGHAAVDAVSAFLQRRELLLVLDNCEHLIAACAELADALVRSCPRLTILSTSREGLNVPGEVLMPVPPMRVPKEDSLPPLDQLREYEAIRLFVDRTRAYQPSFDLSDDNAADVVRICRRLDGIPLALELAAARVRSLSVAELAQRLDERFRLLTGGGRTVVARQQTLRALIDWSYDLLSDPERLLFRRLAVFVHGWTLEAAETVCSGDGLARETVLDLLAHLVDKSLATMQERREMARYSLLETVREYAREKLVDSGEAPILRQRHVDYFVAFAADGALVARRPGSPEFVRMITEYENLRAALEWIRAEPNESERELLLAGSMFGIVSAIGRVAEFRHILGAALQRSDPTARTLGRARALFAMGQLAAMQDDRPTARAVAAEAVELLRALGEQRELAYALFGLAVVGSDDVASASAVIEAKAILEATGDTWSLGLLAFIMADVAQQHGDFVAARHGHTESLAFFRETGDLQWSTSPLISLGRLACADGDYTRARALVEEAVAIRRRNELDNRWSLAIALDSLGEIDRCEGNASAAAPLFEEALGYGRILGDEPIISWSIHNLGHVALQAHELATAAGRFRESLAIRQRSGASANVSAGLAGLAGVATREGSLTDAAWLFGAVDAMLDATHMVLAPADELVRQADLVMIRARLAPELVVAALERGRAATPEDVDIAAKRISSTLVR